MRVVAGSAARHRLKVPATGTRPTSERVREAIFSSLGSQADWSGLAVLDLFSGSGALGIEALSRGAQRAVFVESHRPTAALIKANLAATGLTARGAVLARPVLTYLGGQATEFDLVFADPPYGYPQWEALLEVLERGWLSGEARVVVERSTRDPEPLWPPGWEVRGKRFGETSVDFLLRH